MPCSGCQQRREQLDQAGRDALRGDLAGAAAQLRDVMRSMGEDSARFAQASGQRLAAAHARLKR